MIWPTISIVEFITLVTTALCCLRWQWRDRALIRALFSERSLAETELATARRELKSMELTHATKLAAKNAKHDEICREQ